MTPKRLRRLRRFGSFLAIGACAFQTGPCGLTDQAIGGLLQTGASIITRQIANILTDTVFFLLDNFLVRLTAA